jgi:hypothetical protein
MRKLERCSNLKPTSSFKYCPARDKLLVFVDGEECFCEVDQFVLGNRHNFGSHESKVKLGLVGHRASMAVEGSIIKWACCKA